jgi:phage shock protein PspC (stress-responsive transcriptional regulator)
MMMKSNVGGIDSTVRLIAGFALVILGIFGGLASPWNLAAMGVGAVLILTGLVKFCPAYAIAGANTCSKG